MAWYDLLMRIKANVGQTYLQKHLNYTILLKYFVLAISTNSNHFLMCIEMSLPERNYNSIWQYSNSTAAGSSNSFFIIFMEKGIKQIQITLLMKQDVHAATAQSAFSWLLQKHIELHENSKICWWVLTTLKGYSGDIYLK